MYGQMERKLLTSPGKLFFPQLHISKFKSFSSTFYTLPSGTRVSPTTVTVARIAFTWSIEARIANGQTQDVTAETSMPFANDSDGSQK